MKKIIKLCAILLLTGITALANPIDATTLEKIKAISQAEKEIGLINAISNNDIKKLALNRENLGDIDKFFSNVVEIEGITDQKSSGRCWLFTGLNVVRHKIKTKSDMKKFEFSHNYSFFWDQFEKANLFFDGIIKTRDSAIDSRRVVFYFASPVNDGGQWTTFADIINKYGVVPKSAMPETYNSNNTRMAGKLLKRLLRKNGYLLRKHSEGGKKLAELNEIKIEMLADVYKLLCFTYGTPPEKFEWRYENADGKYSELKEYTPMSFKKEFVDMNTDDYIMLMNDPTREYFKLYEIEEDRSLTEGNNWKYINLPVENIKEYAVKSILDDEAMYFSCDVGKQLNKEIGLLNPQNYDYNSLFNIDFTKLYDKSARILTKESGSSHGMALIGVDLDKNKKVKKWLLENSWGAKSGFDGKLIMTDKWFAEYMFRLVVNKKYMDIKTLKILESKAILLPPWDPMFLMDE